MNLERLLQQLLFVLFDWRWQQWPCIVRIQDEHQSHPHDRLLVA
jgi:hypothetical protein